MKKYKDLTGEKFGRLLVIKRAEDHVSQAGNKAIQWLCICDCGTVKTVSGSGLNSGKQSLVDVTIKK